MVKLKESLMGYAPIAMSALAFYSCKNDKEEEVSKTDILIGEWELVSIDGEEIGGQYDDYSYKISWEFQADGDMIFCYEYESNTDPSENYEDCYDNGNWTLNGDRITIKEGVEDDSDYQYTINIDITSITADEIIGDLSSFDNDNEPEESGELVMRKK
jgi:hypothetical protein